MEESKWMKEVLGAEFFEKYLAAKKRGVGNLFQTGIELGTGRISVSILISVSTKK